MAFYPELMRFENGAPVETPAAMALRRKEILENLQKNAYGDMPAAVPVSGRIVSEDKRCCAGHARLLEIEIRCEFASGAFTFPLLLMLPNAPGKKPLIVLMNFRPGIYDKYIPTEEIIDNGFALACVYYEDITADNGDFSDKLAAFFPRTGSGRDPAKISLWAWSVSRALDYLLQTEEIDASRVGLIGHSRLGKTALWCGANDERIRWVCSNDSGCMGAAYARSFHEGAESTNAIDTQFPFWVCENFRQYKDDPASQPFDQHFLLAAIAPRGVLVNSAGLDLWADPPSEQNTCVAASPAWNAYGKAGYLGQTTPYGENEGCLEGNVAYYKRDGIHFLGRKDWQNFMAFIGKDREAP